MNKRLQKDVIMPISNKANNKEGFLPYIGDADNDRDMLSTAGISVVMMNARSDIKKLANYITKDSDHNGVGFAIRDYFDL